MKYYIGAIDERNGEREYTSWIRFKLTNGDSPAEELDRIAKTWYSEECDNHPEEGKEPDEDYQAGNYWFGGEVVASAGSSHEVIEDVYNAVSMLTDMSGYERKDF